MTPATRPPDALCFDLAPPLAHAGVEALRKGFEWWFPAWVGPIGYAIRDLHVTAGDDVAFAHALARIHGPRSDGDGTDVWVRLTTCLRRIDGGWQIVHEHSSVPFYMDRSLRAAVDLQP